MGAVQRLFSYEHLDRAVGAVITVVALAAGVVTLLGALPATVPTLLAALLVAGSLLLVEVVRILLRDPTARSVRMHRADDIASLDWEYSMSSDSKRWDCVQTAERRFQVQFGEVEELTLDWTPADGDVGERFHRSRPPSAEVVSYRREGGGSVTAQPAHSAGDGRFAFRIRFEPPVRPGESCSFSYRVDLPLYKFATREQVVSTSQKSTTAGVRDFESNSLMVRYPTTRLMLSVFLPLELGASPLSPSVAQGSIRLPEEETRINRGSIYKVDRIVRNGVQGWLMQLDVPDPLLNSSYRVRWRPPIGDLSANPASA